MVARRSVLDVDREVVDPARPCAEDVLQCHPDGVDSSRDPRDDRARGIELAVDGSGSIRAAERVIETGRRLDGYKAAAWRRRVEQDGDIRLGNEVGAAHRAFGIEADGDTRRGRYGEGQVLDSAGEAVEIELDRPGSGDLRIDVERASQHVG